MDKTKEDVQKPEPKERSKEGAEGKILKKSKSMENNPKTVKKGGPSNVDIKPILKKKVETGAKTPKKVKSIELNDKTIEKPKTVEIEAKTIKKAKTIEIEAKTIKKAKTIEIEAKKTKKKVSIQKSVRSVYATSQLTQVPNVSSAPIISGATKVSSMSNVSPPREMQIIPIASVMLKATTPIKEESKKLDSYETKNDGNGIVHMNGYVLLTNKKFKKDDAPNAKNKTTNTIEVTKTLEKNTASKGQLALVPGNGQKSIDIKPTRKSQRTVDMSKEFNGPTQPTKKFSKLGWIFNKPPADIDILNLSDSVFYNLDKDEWFHGIMRKEDVRDLLSKNGQFMVYCDYMELVKPKIFLSCNWNDKRIHFIVKVKKNEVSVFDLKGETISELINRLVEQKTPIHKTHKAILQIPVLKQSWEMKKDDMCLSKRIGQGAFGCVWYGTTKLGGSEEDTYVAIKVPKTKLLEKHINIYPEVLSEVAIMRLFKHENIVKFYGACFSSQPIYMVLEYAEYGCLKKYIKKYKIENNSDLIKMAIDASLGIGYMHSKYGIHCDIAARNCLVFPDNVVKISDFGQAVILKSNEKEHKIDKSEVILAVRWLSPETLQESIYSYKTDVYSFGILLWELFNNCNEPFEKMKTTDLIQGILNGIKPESPGTVMKEVVTLIEEQCLNYDPKKRPDMKEVTKILKSIQSNLTQQAQ